MNEVLKEFAETVRKRRLMVYPYFKDFDRVSVTLKAVVSKGTRRPGIERADKFTFPL